MMRFLAVYSTTQFQRHRTISEESSKNSEKKIKKIFSITPHFKSPKSLRNPGRMHFPTPCTDFVKMSGATLFFHFFIKAECEYALFFGFYKNPSQCEGFVMGNSIKREGERQKHPRYIIVSRMFRFLSPTKLNRYEQAVYSAAHTIQPLCLAGV